jgi:hypothetical protein
LSAVLGNGDLCNHLHAFFLRNHGKLTFPILSSRPSAYVTNSQCHCSSCAFVVPIVAINEDLHGPRQRGLQTVALAKQAGRLSSACPVCGMALERLPCLTQAPCSLG